MSQQHSLGIEKLASEIDGLGQDLLSLAKNDDLKRLLLNIRQPWHTTPAELIYELTIVESMRAQVKSVAALKNALVKTSEIVGRKA